MSQNTEDPKTAAVPPIPPSDPEPHGSPSATSLKKKTYCQEACDHCFNVVVNDSVPGSFFGPHPVNFCCCCRCCCCRCSCVTGRKCRAFLTASSATKLMVFIMLFLIMLLSLFFASPWFIWLNDDKNKMYATMLNTGFDELFLCKDKKEKGPGGCLMHAGYYMTYRCFLAFAVVMLTNAFSMIDVTSTTDDPHRGRCHHGFWLYKYIFLISLLSIIFFAFNGKTDPNSWFEYIVMLFGLCIHAMFNFLELIILMELVEILTIAMKTRQEHGGKFVYAMLTAITFVGDILAFGYIAVWYSYKRDFQTLRLKERVRLSKVHQVPANHSIVEDMMERFEPNWPTTNCLEGERLGNSFFESKVETLHVCLIVGMGAFCLILVMGMLFKKWCCSRYPLQGWLQCSTLILFNLFHLWSALSNSHHVHSRPRCNWALALTPNGWDPIRNPGDVNAKYGLRKGSYDTYSRFTGVIHAVLAVVTLLYCAFLHGPRTKSAPLSLAFRFYITKGYDRLPVIPVVDHSPEGKDYNIALTKLQVYDDEKDEVGQSWSYFYALMFFGSISIMMAMTNSTDFSAPELYNTNQLAFFVKYTFSIVWTLFYCFILICPCTRVYKNYVNPMKKSRKDPDEGVMDKEFEGDPSTSEGASSNTEERSDDTSEDSESSEEIRAIKEKSKVTVTTVTSNTTDNYSYEDEIEEQVNQQKCGCF